LRNLRGLTDLGLDEDVRLNFCQLVPPCRYRILLV
jgi:hypothetical protein